jgi:hypothetical protein
LYDDDGNLTDRIYPDGYHLQFANQSGYLISLGDAHGSLIAYSDFDVFGRPRRQSFKNGLETRALYGGEDASWCPTPSLVLCGIDTFKAGDVVPFWFTRRSINAGFQIDRQFDSDYGITSFAYDEQGRLSRAENDHSSRVYKYDLDDNISQAGKTERRYDARGHLIWANGHPVQYDEGGRIRQIFDSNGIRTEVKYGFDRRAAEIIRPGSATDTMMDLSDRGGKLMILRRRLPSRWRARIPQRRSICQVGR